MLTLYQQHWKVDQWAAFLKDHDIPIMPRSRYLVLAMTEGNEAHWTPREMAKIVTGDPFLALRTLRFAESRRSRTLGRDTTTQMASVMQVGINGLQHIVESCPLCDDLSPGLSNCEFSSVTAAYIARAWSSHRADVSPDEIAFAALLANIGEMMLWHFAPELPEQVRQAMLAGPNSNLAEIQEECVGFTFKALSLALADIWQLPALTTQLIRGVDNVRANIARLANLTAKNIEIDRDNPALVSDIRKIHEWIPSSYTALLAPLPISDAFRSTILSELGAEIN